MRRVDTQTAHTHTHTYTTVSIEHKVDRKTVFSSTFPSLAAHPIDKIAKPKGRNCRGKWCVCECAIWIVDANKRGGKSEEEKKCSNVKEEKLTDFVLKGFTSFYR